MFVKIRARLSHGWHYCIAATMVAVVLTLFAFHPSSRSWQERSTQWIWPLIESNALDQRIVVADIDEQSLKSVGAWPWSRATLAKLIEQILKAQAAVVLVDMVLPDARSDDAVLATTLQSRRVVLAQLFSDASHEGRLANQGMLRGEIVASAQDCSALIQSNSYLANTASLGQFPVGHISPSVDQDGTVRHFPPLVCYEGRVYPGLVLAGLSAAAGVSPDWRLSTSSSWWGRGREVISPALPGFRVPIDDHALGRLSFGRARSSFAAISAQTFLQGQAPKLDGAVVILGASAFGLADAIPTPQSGLATGMEVHLQLMSAMLDDALPYTPKWSQIAVGIWLLIATSVLLRATRSVSMTRFLLTAGVMVCCTVVMSCVSLYVWHWWLEPLIPVLYLCLTSLTWAGLIYRQQQQQKNRVTAHFASYIDPQVAQNLEGQELTSALQVQERHITVLVVDIVGFTRYANTQTDALSAQLLQDFFAAMTRLASKHGAVIDKFIGDAAMVLFNSQQDQVNHARAALEMAADVCVWSVNELQIEPRNLDVAIGITSGLALVGQFGDVQRRTHTAIGNTINKAFRLERLCRELHHHVIVSSETIDQVRHASDTSVSPAFQVDGLRFKLIGSVPLPGFADETLVYGAIAV